MLKPLDEARMMGQMSKGIDEPEVTKGGESQFDEALQEVVEEKPGVETKGLGVEAEPSSVKIDENNIIEKAGTIIPKKPHTNGIGGRAILVGLRIVFLSTKYIKIMQKCHTCGEGNVFTVERLEQ